MNNTLVILSFLWIVYGIFHSFLANNRVKSFFYASFGLSRHNYRFIYNIIALLSLVAIIAFHIQVESNNFFASNYFSLVASILIAVLGATIMTLCIIKYFKQLSGVFKESNAAKLETGGLHRFVRHPLYLGTILLLLGLAIYSPSLKNWIGFIIITIYTLLGTIFEEQKLVAHFGETYKEYQRKTPMIIPRFKPKNKQTIN